MKIPLPSGNFIYIGKQNQEIYLTKKSADLIRDDQGNVNGAISYWSNITPTFYHFYRDSIPLGLVQKFNIQFYLFIEASALRYETYFHLILKFCL